MPGKHSAPTRDRVIAFVTANPGVKPGDVARRIGHKDSTYARRVMREAGLLPETERAPPRRKHGEALAMAVAFLDSQPDPDAVTGPQLKAHMGYTRAASCQDLLDRARQAIAARAAATPARPARPAKAIVRGAAARPDAPPHGGFDILDALFTAFGPLNGQELSGVLVPVPGMHNNGHPVYRDMTGQLHEVRRPW